MIDHCAPKVVAQSSYQSAFQLKHKEPQQKSFKDYFVVSVGGGALIPDPSMMKLKTFRERKIDSKDLCKSNSSIKQ